MAQRYEQLYRTKGGDNLADTEHWNVRFRDVDRRLDGSERSLDDLDAIGDRVEGVALARINTVLTPLILEAQEHLQAIGNLFSAASSSTVTVGAGARSFEISAVDRDTFAALGWLSFHPAGDASVGMVGSVASYDRDTGALAVDIVQAYGFGTFSAWEIAVATPPDLAHAARIDNPHGTTAHQVGAYTIAEVDGIVGPAAAHAARVDNPHGTTAHQVGAYTVTEVDGVVAAAVAALRNWLTNGAGPALDQLNELAAALGNDPDFAVTLTTALAGRLRVDAGQSLTQAQMLQGRANLGVMGAGTLARNEAYAVTPGDIGKRVQCTGTWPLALPAIGGLASGFAIEVFNGGIGYITVDPAGTETINDLATEVIPPGWRGFVTFDGTGWRTPPVGMPWTGTGAYGNTQITPFVSGAYANAPVLCTYDFVATSKRVIATVAANLVLNSGPRSSVLAYAEVWSFASGGFRLNASPLLVATPNDGFTILRGSVHQGGLNIGTSYRIHFRCWNDNNDSAVFANDRVLSVESVL